MPDSMSDGIGVGGAVFGLVGLLFALVGIAMGVTMVRRFAVRRAALTRGVAGWARCLDAYTTRDADGDRRRRVIMGFTFEGREIRFEGNPGRLVVAGDLVEIRYLPEKPEQAVLLGNGASGVGGLVFLLLFCGVFTALGLFFGLGGLGVSLFGFGTFNG